MRREERRGADHLQRLREGELLVVHQVADALDADERGMSFVAMEHIVLDAQCAQCADTADTEQDFLLEAVLPVAAVEVVGDLAVFLEVGLEIRVEQVEIRAADLAFPDARRKRTPREGDGDGQPVAGLVAHGRDREFIEILCLVGRLLRPLCRKTLREVTIPVKQAHGCHRDVLVRGLLEVVAREDAQAARVDLERRVQAVFH